MAQIINVGDTRPPVPGARITDMNPDNGSAAPQLMAPQVPAASLSELLAAHLPQDDPRLYGRAPTTGVPQVGGGEVAQPVPAAPQDFAHRFAPAPTIPVGGINPHSGTRAGVAPFALSPQPAGPDPTEMARQVYGSKEAQMFMSAHPELMDAARHDPVGFASPLKMVMDAAVRASGGPNTMTHKGAGPNGADLTVQMDDPARVAALAKSLDIDPRHAHGVTEPHNYSSDEDWLNSMRGISRQDVDKIWGIQHYLNPNQQAFVQSIKQAQSDIASAKTPQGKQDAQQWYLTLLRYGGMGTEATVVGNPPTPDQ